MPEIKRRSYRSRRRTENAQRTRRNILEAARRLFVQTGYGGARIADIAREAGVAEPTVHAAFGNKRGLVFALLDEMALDAHPDAANRAVAAAAGDPRRQLRLRTAFVVRFLAGGLELIDLARTVSGVEPDLGALWREGEARRYRAVRQLVAAWHDAGALAPGLSAEAATDIWWALSGPDVYRLLVIERGWGRDRFERWLGDTLERELFGAA